MDIIKIAFKNVKDSIGLYKLYIVSMIFSVIIFYQLVNLNNNPLISTLQAYDAFQVLSILALFVMMVFVIFFLFFSNGFYIKERKKEIGIYVLIGTTPKKIGLILAIENMMIYLISITVGIIGGVLLSKLFLMITFKFLNMGITVDFHLSWITVLITALVFLGLGLATSLTSYIRIRSKKIIQLLKSKSMEETMPKGNVLVGILSLFILAGGYYSSSRMDGFNLMTYGLAAIVLVIIGTYLFYRSVMTMIFRWLLSNKGLVYKNNRLLVFSSLMHRVASNYKVYAAVTVFLTCTIASVSSAASFQYGIEDMNQMQYPFTVSFYSNQPSEALNGLSAIVNGYDGDIQYGSEDIEFYQIGAYTTDTAFGDNISSGLIVMGYDTYLRNLEVMNYTHEKHVVIQETLKDDECIFVHPSQSILNVGDIYQVAIGTLTFDAKRNFNAPTFGSVGDVILVNDHVYEQLKAYMDEDGLRYMTGVRVKDDQSFVEAYGEMMHDDIVGLTGSEFVVTRVDSYEAAFDQDTVYLFIRLFYVLGIFLALSFIVATGSIIYFKIISQATEDIKDYDLLNKIGLDRKRMNSIITRQLLMFFICPVIIAFIHTNFVSKALSKFMGVNLLVPFLVSTAFMVIVFLGYYVITISRYKQIVMNRA